VSRVAKKYVVQKIRAATVTERWEQCDPQFFRSLTLAALMKRLFAIFQLETIINSGMLQNEICSQTSSLCFMHDPLDFGSRLYDWLPEREKKASQNTPCGQS